jgi:hypothetical protein
MWRYETVCHWNPEFFLRTCKQTLQFHPHETARSVCLSAFIFVSHTAVVRPPGSSASKCVLCPTHSVTRYLQIVTTRDSQSSRLIHKFHSQTSNAWILHTIQKHGRGKVTYYKFTSIHGHDVIDIRWNIDTWAQHHETLRESIDTWQLGYSSFWTLSIIKYSLD